MSWKIPSAWIEAVAAEPAYTFAHLGPRLAAIAALVPEGASVADIGTDHGTLPSALLRADRASFTWAVDVSPEALAGAERRLARGTAAGRAAVLLGSGFEPLPLGAVQCAVLAGIGVETALGLVEEGLASGHAPDRILFQPEGKAHEVRNAMLRLGYGISAERLVAENGRLFLILGFDRVGGVREISTPEDLFGGPLLRRAPTPAFGAWLAVQAAWLDDLLSRPGEEPDRAAWRQRSSAISNLQVEYLNWSEGPGRGSPGSDNMTA